MRIALFGVDAVTLRLLRESSVPLTVVQAFADHVPSELAAELGITPRPLAEWGSLLDESSLDGVILGGDDSWSDARVEPIRQLIQAEVALLVPWPQCDPLVVYELDMNRQSSGGIVMAMAPLSLHPAVSQLTQFVSNPVDVLGELEQVTFERTMVDRSRDRILKQASEDADVLRRIFGSVQAVTATGIDAKNPMWGGIVLNLTPERGPPVRWTLARDLNGFEFRLTIVGSKDTIIWEGQRHGESSQLSGPGTTVITGDWVNWNWPREIISRLALAVRGEAPDPSWTSVCQSLEVADAIERSASRGRRIDLTGKTVTEKDTFRSVMSAGGCFLILTATLVLILFAVIEGIRMANMGPINADPTSLATGGGVADGAAARPTPYWAILLAVPLFGFLFLQLLQLVIRRPRNREG